MHPHTKKLLVAVLVVQGLILASQWFNEPAARAARNDLNLPDPGARQLQMVDELKALNAKVDRLQATVSGELKVRVMKDEK